ncbi:MAG: ZIP family metal transporter [bacterium]|jgi:ZIP family zinc transporter
MDNPQLWQIALYGLLAGVIGTGTGGLLAYVIPQPRPAVFSGILGFAAGVMMVVVFLELLQQSLHTSGLLVSVIGLVFGLGLFFFLDSALPHKHAITGKLSEKEGDLLKKGLMLTIGIALHNLPEGMAIGSGYAASVQTGFALALVLALHNVPEGLVVAMPMWAVGHNLHGLEVSLLVGIPTGIGAGLGALLGRISPAFLAFSLSFAAGAMLYVVCDELIPDAYQASNSHGVIVGIGLGVVLGLFLTSL